MSQMNKVELLKKLAELPNPYSWRTEINTVRKQELLEKLEEIVENEGFKIHSFIIYLVLFYEYIQDNELANAQEVIRQTEKLLYHFNDNRDDKKPLFWNCRKALRYVLEMSKCHLLIINNLIQEANKIFTTVMKNVNLNERYTKSALMGIEANYLLCYTCKDYPRIIHLLEEAIKLEPDQDFWYFLLGKTYARSRRLTSRFVIPHNKELEALEKAYALRKSACNACYLAQSLREHTNIIYSNNKDFLVPDIKEKLKKDNERALELFKEALELNRQCAHINIRCSVGFLKLPYPYKDMKLAKRCLFKAKDLAPNNLMLLQRLGLIYKREEDYEKAKKYFQASADGGCFGSYMELFSMQLQIKERDIYDIIEALKKLILKYEKDPPIIINIYIQLGWVEYLFQNNLYEAVKYWERPIQVAKTFSNVTSSKCSLKYSEATLNILEIASDEIRFAIQNKNYQNSEELQLYKRIIEFFHLNYPELLKRTPQKRRDAILESCKKNQVEYDRALHTRRERFRKYCARRNRGGGRGRGAAGAAARGFLRKSQSRSTSRNRNVPIRLPTEYDSDDSNISAKEHQNKWRAGCRGSRNSSIERNRSISPQIANSGRTNEQENFLASIRPLLQQNEAKQGRGRGGENSGKWQAGSRGSRNSSVERNRSISPQIANSGRTNKQENFLTSIRPASQQNEAKQGRGRGRGRGRGNWQGRSEENASKSPTRDRSASNKRHPSSERNFARGQARRNSPAEFKRIELYQNQKEEEYRQTMDKIKNIQITPTNPVMRRRESPTNIFQDLNKRLENLNKLDVKWNQPKKIENETSHLASRVEKINLNADEMQERVVEEGNQKRNENEMGENLENETTNLASRVEKIHLNTEMQVDEEQMQTERNNEEEKTKINKKKEKLMKLFQSAQWKGRID